MAIRAKLSMIGIIAASFIAGLVFYYLASSHDRVQKKKYIEDMVSLLIHFIIYIWIGKIAVNFLLFIRDPIAVLAYPSNSKALYVAVVLMILTIFYQHYRNKRIFQFDVFIPVFFAASFVYEFIHILLNGITFEWAYLGLLLLLLIVYLLYIEGALARELSYLLFNI
ncbi:hypothetical protein ACFFIS_10610 [Virgibacillus soli]|uniref:Uncharacterized protein n=1 Tax=Paracerasibacillus soli TaxID=480284 RepID=A0ABU5CME2_9BACI|nr:hypothetical protein [Virgibacillus soli]MDY0407514.1 hypothetical protein [Virgibacillus soli]